MERETCRALIFRCIDFRIKPSVLSRLLEIEGYWEGTYNLAAIAGCAKDLLSDKPADAEFIQKQITLSIDLRNIREIVLLHHDDCGAYGIPDREKECIQQREDMEKASVLLKTRFPALGVKTFFLTGTTSGYLKLERWQ